MKNLNYEDEEEAEFVSKRIILSGDNLLMLNQEWIVKQMKL